MSLVNPSWRRFEALSSRAEAASAAGACLFSLATLEIASIPGTPCFALIERKNPDVWRWAVIRGGDLLIDEGWQATQGSARSAAADGLFQARVGVSLERLTVSEEREESPRRPGSSARLPVTLSGSLGTI